MKVLQSISELSILASIINATGLATDFRNTLLQARECILHGSQHTSSMIMTLAHACAADLYEDMRCR
jgi:hypothetical protein